jgi:hypothetical protein
MLIFWHSAVDHALTFLDFAGAAVPEAMQGRSLSGDGRGNPRGSRKSELLAVQVDCCIIIGVVRRKICFLTV